MQSFFSIPSTPVCTFCGSFYDMINIEKMNSGVMPFTYACNSCMMPHINFFLVKGDPFKFCLMCKRIGPSKVHIYRDCQHSICFDCVKKDFEKNENSLQSCLVCSTECEIKSPWEKASNVVQRRSFDLSIGDISSKRFIRELMCDYVFWHGNLKLLSSQDHDAIRADHYSNILLMNEYFGWLKVASRELTPGGAMYKMWCLHYNRRINYNQICQIYNMSPCPPYEDQRNKEATVWKLLQMGKSEEIITKYWFPGDSKIIEQVKMQAKEPKAAIFVLYLQGLDGHIIPVEFHPLLNQYGLYLSALVVDQDKLPYSDSEFYFNGKKFEHDSSLSQMGVSPGDTIQVVWKK